MNFRLSPDFFNISVRNQSFSNWNMEYGYSKRSTNVDPYPLRVFGTGKQASFTILLRVDNEDIDHVCVPFTKSTFSKNFVPKLANLLHR